MTRSLRSFAMLVAALASAVAYRGLVELAAVAKPPRGIQATEGFLFEPSSSSPWLIYACSVWLIGARLPRLRILAGTKGGGILSLALLLLAAALGTWAPYVGDPSLLVPSLSLALLAAAGLIGGLPGMRTMLLPAAFLLLAIPVPATVLNQIAYPAQIWTADVTTAALDLAGLQISSHADLIYYRGRVFQVIESCSGIRSVITMVMAAVLYQELFFRSRLQSLLLITLAPAVGVFINVVRVITIVLNPLAEIASVHTLQGLAMISAGVLVLAGIDRLLSLGLAPKRRPTPTPSGRTTTLLRWGTLASILVVFAGASLAIPPWEYDRVSMRSLSRMPVEILGASATNLRIEKSYLGSTGYSEWVHRRYGAENDGIYLLVLGNSRLDPRIDSLSVKTAIPGAGWKIEERRSIVFDDGTEGEEFLVSSRRGRRLVHHWREGFEPTALEVGRALLNLDRSPLRRPGRSLILRLSTPVSRSEASRSGARERLESFGAEVRKATPGIQQAVSR